MAMLNNQMVYHISHDLPIMMDPILPQVSWSTTPCCNGVVRTLGTRQRCWFLGWGGWGGVGLSPSLAFTHVLGVGWVGLTTFSCTCTHTSFGWGLWAMSCYDSRCSLALAQTCHTTPEDVLLHMHRHIMLRRTSFFASGFFLHLNRHVIVPWLSEWTSRSKVSGTQVLHTMLETHTPFTICMCHGQNMGCFSPTRDSDSSSVQS